MSPPDPVEPQAKREESGPKHRTDLVTLLFTDMVGSTALKQQLGDRSGAAFFDRHHRIVRDILARFPQGQEIETAGDSFLILFGTPSEAVQFALLLQCRLRKLKEESAVAVGDRIGIHVGEVVIKENQASAKPKELYGIQIDTCSRVTSLAQAGQVLMTRSVFDSARQVLKGEDIAGFDELNPEQKGPPLAWLNHGPYLLKGLEEPVEICEVREASQEALSAPTSSDKAQRQVRADEEQVLGWRPAIGQLVPNTRWLLEKKLGEGGFGEVWLGRHQTMKERRVFKFCFRADRVRFLKREMTLFRLLKERVGDHLNIVRLLEVYFDEPPFYVVMDYVEGKDLKSWCDQQGGADKVALETRLEIVAQVADALQAAHDAGVIHRNVKPTNILVSGQGSVVSGEKHPVVKEESQPNSPLAARPSSLTVKLTDFGIGQVVSEESLAGITRAGFTRTIMSDSSTSHTGTQLYMAPELLAGKPASTRSDIYSLGVVLYQLLVGDLTRPLTTDWTDHVADTLLRDDLKHCFAGNPQDRFPGAGQLAQNLRALPGRQKALAEQQAELAARERAAYRRGMMRTATVAGLIVVALSVLAAVAVRQSRLAKHGEQENRRLLYVSDMNLAHRALKEGNIRRAEALLEAHRPKSGDEDLRGFEWSSLKRLCHGDQSFSFPPQTYAPLCVAFSPDGKLLATGSGSSEGVVRGELKLLDPVTKREVLTLPPQSARVTSVAFSPDNQILSAGTSDGTITLWNVPEQKLVGLLSGHTNGVTALSFSPDGQLLASASLDGTLKFWNMALRREERTVNETNGIIALAFAPDGKRIAVANEDFITLADVATSSQIATPPSQDTYITGLAFSPDGKTLAVANANTFIRLVDLESLGTPMTRVTNLGQHRGNANSVAFSPDGGTLASASDDHTIKLWDMRHRKELAVLKGHRGPVRQVTFSPDGATIASVSDDKTVKLWRASSESDVDVLGHSAWVVNADFSRDGKWLVTGCSDGTMSLWDVTSKRAVRSVRGDTGPVFHVLFSNDSKLVISGGKDQTIKIWDLVSARSEPVSILRGHRGAVFCLGLSPDGNTLVSANGYRDPNPNPGIVKFWDWSTRQEMASLVAHPKGILSLAISPDGKLFATGSWDGTIKLWDFASRKLIAHFNHIKGEGARLAFSPDGKVLVSGGSGPIIFWDVVKRQKLHTIDGITGGVDGLVFAHDGKTLVQASGNGSVRLWNVATRKELLTLYGHEGFLGIPVFSPDGRVLATPSADHTVRLWPAGRFLQDGSDDVSNDK